MPWSRNACSAGVIFPAGPFAEELADGPSGQVAVLFRTGQTELRPERFLIQQEPGVRMAGRGDVAQRAEGVEAGKQWDREAVTSGIQPERARPGQDPDAVARPDGGVIGDALGVVPHAVLVDEPAAGRVGDPEHQAIRRVRHSGQQLLGRPPKVSGQNLRTRS